MPREGEYNNELIQLLETENKIRLLEQYKGAKQRHLMQCLECDHIWTSTPLSKRQSLRKYRTTGCPNCKTINNDKKHAESREQNILELQNRGIIILDPNYDGRRLGYDSKDDSKILVKNIHCGHEFYCTPTNLLIRKVECGICGPSKRSEKNTEWSKANSLKWQETADEWLIYKSKVHNLSYVNYKLYKHIINPNDCPSGTAGTEGAYQLDHIIPKRYCFDNNIPFELCAHHTNLQMILWLDNLKKEQILILKIFLTH